MKPRAPRGVGFDVPQLAAATIAQDPTPFVGRSDDPNLPNGLWTEGVAGRYGGSTSPWLRADAASCPAR